MSSTTYYHFWANIHSYGKQNEFVVTIKIKYIFKYTLYVQHTQKTYIINIPHTDMYVQAKWECSQHVLVKLTSVSVIPTVCFLIPVLILIPCYIYQRSKVGKSFSGYNTGGADKSLARPNWKNNFLGDVAACREMAYVLFVMQTDTQSA